MVDFEDSPIQAEINKLQEEISSKANTEQLLPDVVDQALEQETEEVEEIEEVVEDEELEEEVEEEGGEIEEDLPKSNADWAKHRKELRRIEKEKQELAEKMAKLEGRIDEKDRNETKATASLEAPVDAEPDKEFEPDEWNSWKLRQLENIVAQQSQALNSQMVSNTVNSARNELKGLETRFAKNNPDYFDAKEHLLKREYNVIKLQYPHATDAQIQEQLSNSELEIAAQISTQGMDPVKVFYEMAKESGYSPQEVKRASKADGIKNIQKNRKRSGSLNGVTNAGNPGAMSSDEIVGMTLEKAMGLSKNDWHALNKESVNKSFG